MTGLAFIIRYSVAHGYEDQALALARRLFAVYDEAIDTLSLLPITDDDFSLTFGDLLLVSQQRDGQPPTVAAVRAYLATQVGQQDDQM